MANRELINKDVTLLFEAIFSRMKDSDIDNIINHRGQVTYAAMNLSTSAQIEAQKQQQDVIKSAISNIIDHDMIAILKVLKECELIKVLDENN